MIYHLLTHEQTFVSFSTLSISSIPPQISLVCNWMVQSQYMSVKSSHIHPVGCKSRCLILLSNIAEQQPALIQMSAILRGLKRGFAKQVHFEFTAYCKLSCPFPQKQSVCGGGVFDFWRVFLNVSSILHYYFKCIADTPQLLESILPKKQQQ